MEEKFDEIFSTENKIYTINLIPKQKVYGEKLIIKNNIEYREWNPFKSKYCAAIVNGLKKNIFQKNSKILYLGSAEGTTVSHVSDIVGQNGEIYCIDISTIAMQKLTKLASIRENILPILADANNINEYSEFFEEKVDSIFIDISQRNQIEIFLKNSIFLKKNGLAGISLKTRSISQSEKVSDILEKEKEKLKNDFEIEQIINLEPFEKQHYFILVRKK